MDGNGKKDNSLADIELGKSTESTENPMNSSSHNAESSESSHPEGEYVPDEGDTESEAEVKKEMHYRRGKNKTQTLEDALKVTISNSRMKRVMKQFQDQEDHESKKKAIIAFKAATDPSYLIQSSVDEIWMAVLRREAWAQVPMKMIGTSCAQVILCFIALLANNDPVNTSTLVMAIIYTITMASVNPFDVTWDLVGIVEKEGRKIARKNGWILAWFVLFLSLPLLAIGFGVTIIFDFFVGKVLDCSYGSLINTVIDAIVKGTAISVGLRSQNPINAIQTFVGFDFISSMDEVIIESIQVDMKAMTSLGNATPNW
eukprot:CAMPEP_0170373356 /NCGR_PEP_ID=MMETSP0117_2-20130122/10027_1 /TAXON_ID=400756 /ORGANISM="Durinskia baltica, Strain CSIRO CS-38" /LENGTH=314 /DNA_ID=CAMNT_0010628245 /DNA_START=25 /DNA_END=966 /DNA_ORIENTATION=+